MTRRTTAALKGYFNTGDVPGEANFSDMIDSLTRNFHPEDYGAAGDGTTDDTAAIQAAIDAAEAAGGGRVVLSRTYRVSEAGQIAPSGINNWRYALWINGDHIAIDGGGVGKLVMTEAPPNGCVVVLFGNGGSSNGTYPGDNGTWVSDVGITGVTIDTSAINHATSAKPGSYITMFYCQRWFIDNCFIPDGRALYGDTAIAGSRSSRYGTITRNTILYPNNTGIWVDGGRYIRIANNHIEHSARSGIQVQANLDNGMACYYNTIVGNTVVDYGFSFAGSVGVGLSGAYRCVVANNYLQTSSAGTGIVVQAYATAVGKAVGSNNVISGNYIRRDNTSGTTIGVKLEGFDANAFDGLALECGENQIAGNSISGWYMGAQAMAQAVRNSFVGNVIDCQYAVREMASTASGNLWGSNTLSANAITRDLDMTYSVPYFRPGASIMLKNQGYQKIHWEATQFIMTGSGDPNGVVTAAIGSMYLRRDGGANTTLYIKESGSSNTGWVAK